jgi:carbon starvation protein
MLAATLTSLTTTFITNITKLAAGTGALMKEGIQTAIIVTIFILAVILVVEGAKTLICLYKKN